MTTKPQNNVVMKLLFILFLAIFFFSNSYTQQIFGEDSLCNGSVSIK